MGNEDVAAAGLSGMAGFGTKRPLDSRVTIEQIEAANVLSSFGRHCRSSPKRLKLHMTGHCSTLQNQLGDAVDGGSVLSPGWQLTGEPITYPHNFKPLTQRMGSKPWHKVDLAAVFTKIGRHDLRQTLEGEWKPEDFPAGKYSSRGRFSRFAADTFFAAGRILLGLSESAPIEFTKMRKMSGCTTKQWECHWCKQDKVSVTTDSLAKQLHLDQLHAYGQCTRCFMITRTEFQGKLVIECAVRPFDITSYVELCDQVAGHHQLFWYPSDDWSNKMTSNKVKLDHKQNVATRKGFLLSQVIPWKLEEAREHSNPAPKL